MFAFVEGGHIMSISIFSLIFNGRGCSDMTFSHRQRHESSVRAFRYFLIMAFIIAVLCIGSAMIVDASESASASEKTRLYTSISINESDTLWDIEALYNDGSENRDSYIQSIMQMNHMTSDVLYSGQKLIVYYYK
jgi:hypothetical protein